MLRNRAKDTTAVAGTASRVALGLLALIVVLSAGAWAAFRWTHPISSPSPEGKQTLRQVYFILNTYAHRQDRPFFFPQATLFPDALRPDLPDLSTLESPQDPAVRNFLLGRGEPRICYLGYVAGKEPAGLAVLDALEDGNALDQPLRLRRPVHAFTLYANGHRYLRTLPRLSQAAPIQLIREISNPGASTAIEHALPLAWELPHGNPPGGWVLYMDATIQWLPYPGEFPMSEEFVGRVRDLLAGRSASPAGRAAEDANLRVYGIRPLTELKLKKAFEADLLDYTHAYLARRIADGAPILEELATPLVLVDLLYDFEQWNPPTDADLDRARQDLLNASDPKAAVLCAACLCRSPANFDKFCAWGDPADELQDLGREALRDMPREVVLSVLQEAVDALPRRPPSKTGTDKENVERLLKELREDEDRTPPA